MKGRIAISAGRSTQMLAAPKNENATIARFLGVQGFASSLSDEK